MIRARRIVRLASQSFLGAAVLPLLLLAGCAAPPVTSPPGTVTTLVLLRHADRNPMQDDLTAEGRARAAALPKALADVPIDAIYTLQIKRNIATAEPLARERNLPIQVIEESMIAARLVAENPGKTVVWVGNTDNIAVIYDALRGDGAPPIQYGDLYIVWLPDNEGSSTVEKRRFTP